MIVSFWNSSNHRSGVTTNAASIALFYALRFKKKVALFENHIPSEIGLSDILIGKKESNSIFEEPMYYGKKNRVQDIYRYIKAGFPIKNMSDSAIHLADGRLHYYPQDDYGSHDLLDYELNKIIDPFLDMLSKRYEIVIVDLKQFNTMTTKRIIERSDVVFLNVLPDNKVLEDFFGNHTCALEKFYFIFSKFCKTDEEFKEKFLREFPINPKFVSYIPYNENFERTCRGGHLEGFLQKNKWATLGQKPFEFIYELRRMTNFMKEISEKKKEEEDEKKAMEEGRSHSS